MVLTKTIDTLPVTNLNKHFEVFWPAKLAYHTFYLCLDPKSPLRRNSCCLLEYVAIRVLSQTHSNYVNLFFLFLFSFPSMDSLFLKALKWSKAFQVFPCSRQGTVVVAQSVVLGSDQGEQDVVLGKQGGGMGDGLLG